MKLKQHTLTVVLLTGLAAGALNVHAEDMSNMPGMDDQAGQTNASTGSTNALVKPYPFNYCLVSGDKFDGDMGKPVMLVYKGQEWKFCCKDCVKDFKKNPEKWMKKLADEQAKTAETK